MEEKRAHARIDELTHRFSDLEGTLSDHITQHRDLEAALAKNTEMTQTIADNTTEIVQIIKGAKGLRSLIIWVTPVIIAVGAMWAFIKGD